MKREKLIRNLDKLIEQTDEEAFDRGYSDGWDDGQLSGIDIAKTYVRSIMEQSIQLSMDANKLRDAKATKDVMDWLFALWNYDPVEAERRIREEEENSDGFGLIR